MIFTTSYKTPGLEELLTYLPMSVGAREIVELGTQQGHSAVLLAKSGAHVETYDSFEEKYFYHPYGETHADMGKAIENVKKYNIDVFKKNVLKLESKKCDVLHIDICNHFGNVLPLLERWERNVSKLILLEGGVYNSWQEKYDFFPYHNSLWRFKNWNCIVVKGNKQYALTIMSRT